MERKGSYRQRTLPRQAHSTPCSRNAQLHALYYPAGCTRNIRPSQSICCRMANEVPRSPKWGHESKADPQRPPFPSKRSCPLGLKNLMPCLCKCSQDSGSARIYCNDLFKRGMELWPHLGCWFLLRSRGPRARSSPVPKESSS